LRRYFKYPNDVGLLNDVREWLVKQIKRMGKVVGKKSIRTYRRSARKEYLNFSKKKVKTKKTIAKAKKKMLQYVRRNIRQLRDLIQIVRIRRYKIHNKIKERLAVAEEILRQQWEMYKRKVNRIAHRIVSLHRPYVRPIKRGKQRRDTEFGGKGAVVHVDGFLFLDYFKHEAYDEAELAVYHVAAYQERFGTSPPTLRAIKNTGSWITGNVWGRWGSEPRSSRGGAEPKKNPQKMLGSRTNRESEIGWKPISVTGKNITDWIVYGMPELTDRRCGCGRASWP
jgi:hypothetical protein